MGIKLQDTDLHHEAPEIAARLWESGFRPLQACELQAGMVVAYFETDVFGLEAHAPAMSAQIRSVVTEDGETVVEHSAGRTEADECTEVWAK